VASNRPPSPVSSSRTSAPVWLKASNAAAVVMDVHTGEVLAMVSLPTFDNNIFTRSLSEEELAAVLEDAGKPLVNHTIAERYPPGSSFKPIVYTENKKGERSAVVIEYFLERDYALYWHFAPFFREDNFRKEETNVFGETGDTNMLCLPPGEDTAPNLPRVAGPGADWHADYTAWMEKT
ncbi:MAG: hypothetical protein IIC06_02275, partial [Proteobacteria bacterium]|nr:hypothetical protein [Pseudomonadota bacterium]